jgi:hypothetical protein
VVDGRLVVSFAAPNGWAWPFLGSGPITFRSVRRILLGAALLTAFAAGPVTGALLFVLSPCAPGSTADLCQLAAPNVVAVLLPALAGPMLVLSAVVTANLLRDRWPMLVRPLLLGGFAAVAVSCAAATALTAIAPSSYSVPAHSAMK